MIAFVKEFGMSHRFGNRRRFATELCGPYACDETEDTRVSCLLEIGQTKVAIKIPSQVFQQYLAGAYGDVVLHLPRGRVARVETAPRLSQAERKAASGWAAEMEDFDRF